MDFTSEEYICVCFEVLVRFCGFWCVLCNTINPREHSFEGSRSLTSGACGSSVLSSFLPSRLVISQRFVSSSKFLVQYLKPFLVHLT